MNQAKLYSDATSLPDEKAPAVDTPEQAMHKQLILNWRNDAITRIKVAELEKQITELLEEATQLAVSYPQTNNHQQIVQKLVKADTLRKVVDSYAQ